MRWLRKPRAQPWLGVAALVLASPALFGRLVLDDHVLWLLARGDPGIRGFHAHPLFLFNFTSGRPEDNRALMDAGALLPWWSDPHHLNAFFRPLASLTHLLDFSAWPASPWLMHVHSLLWWVVLLLVVARAYRAFASSDSAVTTLAFGMFALDGAHGMTIAWVANRNALVSAALSLSALLLHHRWLARGFRQGAWLGPACFALGLAGGETAVAVFGYLLAYALVIERAPLGRRLLHLLPYLGLLVLWRVLFARLGLGAVGSGDYHDPSHEPLAYLWGLVQHVPVLLSAQLGPPIADAWFWGPPELHLAIWLYSVFTMLFVLAAGHVLLSRDAETRFWTLGMVLSACAVAASVPGERLLLVPGVGAAMLVAKLIWKLLPRALSALPAGAATPPAHASVPPFWTRPLLPLLVLFHLVLAPLLLPTWAWSIHMFGTAIERLDRGIPASPEITGRSVIVVNAPFDLLLSYIQIARQARGVPRPAHLYWLASASSELTVETRDQHTLRVRPARGFLFAPPERHYRGDPSALVAGTTVALSEMTAEVVEVTGDRRPAAVDFRFREPLRSPAYIVLRYERGQLLPFVPPPPGHSLRFPRVDFFVTLLSQALRPYS